MTRFDNISYAELIHTIYVDPWHNKKDKSRQITQHSIQAYYLVPFVIEKLLGKSHPELLLDQGQFEDLHLPADTDAIQILNNDLAELQKDN